MVPDRQTEEPQDSTIRGKTKNHFPVRVKLNFFLSRTNGILSICTTSSRVRFRPSGKDTGTPGEVMHLEQSYVSLAWLNP